MPFDDELKFESALVELLVTKCGWEKEVLKNPTEELLIENWKNILFESNKEVDILNGCELTDGEMSQILTQINILKTPLKLNGFINGKTVSIRRDNQNDKLHYGKNVSLKIYDRMEIAGGKSRYQIAEQPIFKTNNNVYPSRRGDIMLLINGMPVFHIELKKSGIPTSQATTQIEKYMNNGVYSGIFSLIQIFVAMNPEEQLYFANPGKDGKFNSDFYFHWEDYNNEIVSDWRNFTIKVLSIPMAHEMVGFYTIADDTDGILKVMRSYQYYAASAISNAVAKSDWTSESRRGGYIWHTTGSGKTMTSFKAAQLIANSGDVDKVVFLLDRVELGTQSLTNYRNFADIDESVQATEDTLVLESKLASDEPDDTLIVTSIQKMSRIKEDAKLKARDLDKMQQKHIVFIIDECHRSQIGKMHQDIIDTFPNAMYFGFTGTPDLDFTADVFGDELHRYTIYHGIRDKNVLGFDPYLISTFSEKDLRTNIGLEKCHCKSVEEAMSKEDTKKVFLYYMNQGAEKCPMTVIESMIPSAQYETDRHEDAVVGEILDNWLIRSVGRKFHAILATSSIPEAIKYYKKIKENNNIGLKITAVFDPSDNNAPNSISKMNGITEILTDYKDLFGLEYTIGTYDKFKKDVCSRLAHKKPYVDIENNPNQQIDLIIVVDQLLTGFDSKWINTLYLDKKMVGKNFIQAISRTNRLYGPDKPHGTIVWYRYPFTTAQNLHDAVKDYSGNIPFGLFVNKLDKNLLNMNLKYSEINELFISAGITNFERNSDDISWRKKFSKLFLEFDKYLQSAKIQGFRWNKLSYDFRIDDKIKTIDLDLDEKIYLILVQRYKELFGNGGSGGDSVPYDIDTHITQIKTDSIDDDYINSKFKIYLKELNNGDKESRENAIVELHKTFATLSQQDQKFAKLFLQDLESGNVITVEGKSFRDYITEYRCNAKDTFIHEFSEGIGINESKLVYLISLGLNNDNINEFGRYDDLINGIDIEKAKAYFEKRDSSELSYRETRLLADKELRKIITNINSFY